MSKWIVFDQPTRKTFGVERGAEILVDVDTIDGEKDFLVTCLCAACREIDAVGVADAMDPGGDGIEDGSYFLTHHVEVYMEYQGPNEYDTWLEVNGEEPN